MNTCKTCKGWDKDMYACMRVTVFNSIYERVKGSDFGIFATASDDQGLEYEMKTGPDFSCNNYTKRNEQ